MKFKENPNHHFSYIRADYPIHPYELVSAVCPKCFTMTVYGQFDYSGVECMECDPDGVTCIDKDKVLLYVQKRNYGYVIE